MMTKVMDLEVMVGCKFCGKVSTLKVNSIDFMMWEQFGECIQNAMPYLTADERELLISGTCGDCWHKMFAFYDEEE